MIAQALAFDMQSALNPFSFPATTLSFKSPIEYTLISNILQDIFQLFFVQVAYKTKKNGVQVNVLRNANIFLECN